ncbi:hypothetical protein L3X38_037738 [Prunus dulcis]|uniref:Uncharacterized protein n=1 Tax=Prunus dulcis TaxID=3755 RepID=A0AAD4V3Q6_PRUDU|nr:hypothetical protein L3X38_037738 [Prunus dulcis]
MPTPNESLMVAAVPNVLFCLKCRRNRSEGGAGVVSVSSAAVPLLSRQCPNGSARTYADFGPESDPEFGSYFDDPEPDPESGSYFDDPDYDDDDDPDSDDDPDPHSDDDPDLEFVSDSDPDPDFDSESGPDSGSDPDPNS